MSQRNGHDGAGGSPEPTPHEVVGTEPAATGIIARARAAERAAAEQAARDRAYDEAHPEVPPHSLTHHPDGSERMMVISRPSGAGEREISVSEWNRNPAFHRAEAGAWVIKFTEVVSQHHSDEVI